MWADIGAFPPSHGRRACSTAAVARSRADASSRSISARNGEPSTIPWAASRAVTDLYVRPDGRQLSALAELLANGALSVPIASVRPLEEAAQALRDVVAGADGAIVLSLRT